MDYRDINDYEQLYLVAENDDEAEEVIFRKYKPIIYAIADKYYNYFKFRGIDKDDLVQEGYVGLSNAIKSYKDNQSALFYTFCSICINRQVRGYCRQFLSTKNEILNNAYSFDNIIIDDDITFDPEDEDCSGSPDFYVSSDYIFTKLIKFKHKLPLVQSLIFELRYNGFKYKEIAKLLDLSVSSVDRYIQICKGRYKLEFEKI